MDPVFPDIKYCKETFYHNLLLSYYNERKRGIKTLQ